MGPNVNLKEKCEETSTQQLLADLTTDLEETITAQICLSNQLLDANLGKVENAKDILILKSDLVDTVKSNQLPMESNNTSSNTTDPKEENTSEDVDETNLQNSTETPTEESSEVVAEATVSTPVSKQDVSRATIISVEELPPIRTDSTMTASEAEDNIEERLSQLDGTPVQPLTSNEVCNVDHEDSVMGSIPATPPRTPPPQHQEQHVQQISEQNQQTPSTPLSQQMQQQNTFTPQSSTSSMNTMGSTNIPKDFMKDSAGEIEDQDIEEVLKALKGLDSSTAADTICDLNVLFNEVYTTLNYEEINSQNAAQKPNPLKEVQAEIEKKQQTMQRKIDFLLRRLRKVQARYMCKHTSEEISGLFEWSARIVSKSAKLSHEDDISERQQLNYAEEKSHPVTSTQISTILRKIEMVANSQQLSTTSSNVAVNIGRRKTKKMMNSTPEVQAAERKMATVVPIFDSKITEEIGHVTGLLQSEMHEVQNSIDSDATESSSGGESADEMVTYNNQIQQSLQIAKRAAWRYSRDRAAIASRWSWLLSQISDLEIKIRQHSELHQEIIRSKGPVVNGMESSSSIVNATQTSFNGYKGAQAGTDGKESSEELPGCCRTRGILSSNFRKRKLFQTTNIHTFSKKAARPSTIKCGCQWPLHPCALCTGRSDPTAPRDLPDTMMMSDRVALLDPGYHPVLSFPEDISNSIHFEAIARQPEWQQRVMRCPVKNIAKGVWKAEREAAAAHALMGKKNSETVKRKYVKKKDLIKEQQHPNNGNGTGTLSMSSTPLVANKLMKNSKIARYHRYQAMDDTVMQMKTSSGMINHNNNNNSYTHRTSDYHHQNYAQYNPSQAHSSSISSIVRNSKNRKLSSSAANSTFHYNHYSNDNNQSNSELNYLHSDSWDSLVTRSRTSSPTHGGSSNYHRYERSLDRRNRTSYDIDNIVIPYSVAAATRVEILPYKEIPTPKWRVIEEENGRAVGTSSNAIENNISKSVEDASSVVCNNKNDAQNSSDSSSQAVVSDTKPKVNNITGSNNVEETVNTTESESPTENSVENNKCRLTTKRTYSEKENSVDSIDAFDPIKDINNKSTKESKSEPVVKKPKVEDDKQEENANLDTAKEDVLNEKEVPNNDAPEEEGVEDITDEAMGLRHERALIEERRKFQTFLKFPWSTRSRANRRIDSRAESSGANTPDPASPAPNTPSVGGGDLESLPSPAAPSTPLNPLDSIAEGVEPTGLLNNSIAPPPSSIQNSSKRYERRRTTSAKKDREQERRSSTPDPKELIPPYEPLKFPIPNEVFENMVKMMPADHHDEIPDSSEMVVDKASKSENNLKNDSFAKRSNASDKNTSENSITRREASEYNSDVIGNNDGGYSKHHLATDEEFQFETFDGQRNLICDSDTSDAEPFSDDDPNDPEWKGESDEKDKMRKKI